MSPNSLQGPIMIMAGGTGGHVYPALAVADELTESGQQILWLGTANGLEARVVPDKGYSLLTIDVSGVRGKGIIKKLSAPFLVMRAVIQAMRLFKQHKPKAVLGMGGFASGPGGLAAFLLRIPLLVHEQNAIAGLTNNILSRFASVVMEAFPDTFAKNLKAHATGNPVRKDILAMPAPESRFNGRNDEINLLVIGGSLGARRLNQVLPQALAELKDSLSIKVRHQSGEKHIDDAKSSYQQAGVDAELLPFIEDMAAAYSWADIIVCRAGAMTIAELAIVGVASVLVPFPYAVDDHQTANAKYLSDQDCAVLLQEAELDAVKLARAITELCQSREKLLDIANRARKLGKTDATKRVANFCLEAAYA